MSEQAQSADSETRDRGLDARRFEVLDELQRIANEIRQLSDRVDEARQRQRDLVVEAVDDLDIRLPLIAQNASLSPQRIHSLRQEEIERRERIDASLNRYFTYSSRKARNAISEKFEDDLQRFVQSEMRGVPLSRIETAVRNAIVHFNAATAEKVDEATVEVRLEPSGGELREARETARRRTAKRSRPPEGD